MRRALALAALALLSGCRTPVLIAAPAEAKANHDIDWHVESEPAAEPAKAQKPAPEPAP